MTQLCTIGLAVVDLVLTVDRLPTGPGKHFASSARLVGGGPAATAAVTAVRLGGSARFVGRVGDDHLGDLIIDGLITDGVDVQGVTVVAGAGSPSSAVLVTPDGDRTIVNRTDAAALHTEPPGPLPEADAMLADVRWPAGANSAMAAALAQGVPGVLDLDRTDNGVPSTAVEMATHVVAALDAFDGLAPEAAVRDLAGRTDAWVAVTTGRDGVVWLDGGDVRRLAPPPVVVVDTLGAGDVFHGAFALALAEGRDEESALRFASAAAAGKCARPGGRAGIPSRHEVDALEAATWR